MKKYYQAIQVSVLKRDQGRGEHPEDAIDIPDDVSVDKDEDKSDEKNGRLIVCH